MPIYEYACTRCRRISSHLVFHPDSFEPFCTHCGAKEVKKLVSRVHVRLSEETRLERLTDPSMLAGLDENDPKSMAKWMKKMGSLAGDDLGEDFDQMVDEAVEEAAMEASKGGGEEGASESGASAAGEEL